MSSKYSSKESIEELLKKEGINHEINSHDCFLTCPPAVEYFSKNNPKIGSPFVYCKNLFLKNKAGGFYLVTANSETNTDYKKLCKIFKTKNGNIREGSKEKLKEYLNVEPGHVNTFALLNLNDEQKKDIQFHLDKGVIDNFKYMGEPAMNSSNTCWIAPNDLISLLEKNGIKINITDFNEELSENKKEEDKKEEKNNEKKGKKQDKNKEKNKDNDEDISSLGIQNKKEINFPDWYQEVITKSEMVEYYDISGCYILRPWSYEIWEKIQEYFDAKIKKLGVKNCYFPIFVSQKALFKEKEHVEGFSPEVAWVTKSGKSEINPPIAIRPTSETIMYPAYAKWIRSHRDLPLMLNQWTNVVRWEFKNPTPFIRTREFLWQEGHTAHATYEESMDMVYKILGYYKDVYEDLCACPVIQGTKSENEKFAGGYITTSIETILPNGKGVQCATSHNLGQNFSKMFEIQYLDKNKNKQYVWQASWGLTTRTIGVIVMMHSDNKGLVLPPKIAPLQVIIIPIKTSKDNAEEILSVGEKIYGQLKEASVRVFLDDSDLHTPGWKFANWELKGVPIRIEYGKKDLSKGKVTFYCRDTEEKFLVDIDQVENKVKETLDTIQKRMFNKQLDRIKKQRSDAKFFDTFLEGLNKGNIVYTPWCNEAECEEKVKERVKKIANEGEEESVGTCKTLNIPLDQSDFKKGDKCFNCKKEAKVIAIWGRSY